MPADNIYFRLRNQILQAKRDQLGLPIAAHPTVPWAVVMDWGVPNGTASNDFASSAPGATTTNFCRTTRYRDAANTDAFPAISGDTAN